VNNRRRGSRGRPPPLFARTLIAAVVVFVFGEARDRVGDDARRWRPEAGCPSTIISELEIRITGSDQRARNEEK